MAKNIKFQIFIDNLIKLTSHTNPKESLFSYWIYLRFFYLWSIKKSDEKKSQINEDERTRRHSCNFSAAFKSKGIYSAFTNTIPIEDKEEKTDLKKQQKTTANELTEILDQIRYHIPGTVVFNFFFLKNKFYSS